MAERVMFVPECHVDTALAHVLLADRRNFVNHVHGVPNVAKALQKQAESNRGPRFVVGIVDNDKKLWDVKALRPFSLLRQEYTGPTCRYRIYQHSAQASHFLIILDPVCDTWIFEAAAAAGLHLADFNLPATLDGFIAVVKDEDAENNPDLRSLLRAIKREQPPAYRELAEFVAEIMDTGSKLWREP